MSAWRNRSARERRAIGVGACAVAAALLAFAVPPLLAERQRLMADLPRLRAEAAAFHADAAEVEQLRARVGGREQDLRQLVKSTAGFSLPARVVMAMMPDGRLQLDLDAVAAKEWWTFVVAMQERHGVRTVSGRIAAEGEAGRIRVSAVLERGD